MRHLFILASLIACASARLQPQVAFRCGKPSIYLSLSGPTRAGWLRYDPQGCVDQLEDVLGFCKIVYPELAANFSGVVPSADVLQIHNWCDFREKRCEGRSHNIPLARPFKCLTTPFVPEALLVPDKCSFGHVFAPAVEAQCRNLDGWRAEGIAQCRSKPNKTALYSMGVLTPCRKDPMEIGGRQRYAGVEFVCCPPEVEVATAAQAYIVDRPLPQKHHVVGVHPTARTSPAPRRAAAPSTSHQPALSSPDRFLAEQMALQRKERQQEEHLETVFRRAMEKLASMQDRGDGAVEALRAELVKRFRIKFQQTLSDEVAKWRALEMDHETRVSKETERLMVEVRKVFVKAVSADQPKEEEVWEALEELVGLVMRAKLRALSHFSHLIVSDPAEAMNERQLLNEHFARLNLTLQEVLAELKRVPQMEQHLRQRAKELAEKYGNLEASKSILLAASATIRNQGGNASKMKLQREGDERMKRVLDRYGGKRKIKMTRRKSIVFADMPKPQPATVAAEDAEERSSEAEEEEDSAGETAAFPEPRRAANSVYHTVERVPGVKQMALQHTKDQAEPGAVSDATLATFQVGSLIGGLVAGMALLLLVLVVVLAIRHRQERPHAGYVMSVVELDPADEQSVCPPAEERHLANMQINGYENPTYKYFEKQ